MNLKKMEVNIKEDEAIDAITADMVKTIQPGEEIDLPNGYTLYHYFDDEFICLKDKDEEEIYCVQYSGNEVVLTSLI